MEHGVAALGPYRGLGMGRWTRRRTGGGGGRWVLGLVSCCRLVLPARLLVCSWPVDAAWNSQSRADDFLCDDDNGQTADQQCRRTTYASVIVAAQPRLTLRGAAAGPWAAHALARNVEIVACHWPKGLDAGVGANSWWAPGPACWRAPCRLGLHFSFFCSGPAKRSFLELPKGRI